MAVTPTTHVPDRRRFVTHLAAALGIPALLSACGKIMGQDSQVLSNNLLGSVDTSTTANSATNYTPVVTPGIPTLPFEVDASGVKVFRLTAEPVTVMFPDKSDPHGMAKRPIHAWGFNGSMPGPTIEIVEGDTVRIIVQNNLSEPTTIHWHGLHIPIEMDGVPMFSQPPIPPGGNFIYEFTVEQHGTYFYHSHVMQAKQIGLGLMGFFIVHPKNPEPWMKVDREYAYFLQIWMIQPGNPIPDTVEMSDFNYFTMNGRPGPDIVPMKAKLGERVRIRLANLSMMVHPIHLHGHTFKITDLGAGFLPQHQHMSANTVNISSAEARAVDWTAERVGKWVFHCHFAHHNMNDMHRTPLPGGGGHAGHSMMDMEGMHTWIEID